MEILDEKDLERLARSPRMITEVSRVLDIDGVHVKYRFTWNHRDKERKQDFSRRLIERRSCKKAIRDKVIERAGEDIVEAQVVRMRDGRSETRYFALYEYLRAHVECCLPKLMRKAGFPPYTLKCVEPREFGLRWMYVDAVMLFDEYIPMTEFNKMARRFPTLETGHRYRWGYYAPTGRWNRIGCDFGWCRSIAEKMLDDQIDELKKVESA